MEGEARFLNHARSSYRCAIDQAFPVHFTETELDELLREAREGLLHRWRRGGESWNASG